MDEVAIETETIRLDALLKWAGVAQTGGQAKWLIQAGQVEVNGQPETRRSRKLKPGDRIDVQGGGSFSLVAGPAAPEADQ